MSSVVLILQCNGHGSPRIEVMAGGPNLPSSWSLPGLVSSGSIAKKHRGVTLRKMLQYVEWRKIWQHHKRILTSKTRNKPATRFLTGLCLCSKSTTFCYLIPASRCVPGRITKTLSISNIAFYTIDQKIESSFFSP